MRRSRTIGLTLAAASLALVAAVTAQQTQQKSHELGYDDTPFIPGQKWRVHDVTRPRPRVVTPGAKPGDPPSDAVVLFDGKDLSRWVNSRRGVIGDAAWKVESGYLEVAPGTGDLVTREKFGDAQFHVEWAAPAEVHGSSQGRGNSGFLIMSRYEIQILDTTTTPVPFKAATE